MEEKGGFLHIIFMFIGVACLTLGVFYYLTETEPKEGLSINPVTENNDDNKKNEQIIISNTIKGFDIKENEEVEITLGNGSKIKLSNSISENEENLLYNGEALITYEDLNLINKYFVYNDYVVVFSYSLVDRTGIIYTIDSEKIVQKIEEIDLNNRVMIPVNMEILDDKIIVDGSRVNDDVLSLQDGNISLCNDDELSLHSISLDSPLKIEYSMNIVNKNVTFDFVKIIETVDSAKKIVCTTSE